MALMFPRLAQNFAKNGYFPTDEQSLENILSFVEFNEQSTQILDPCAGEGVALAEFKHYLGTNSNVNAVGVEYDEHRAYHAKSLLDNCIHGDIFDCLIKRNQFGLLFLNPPYGDLVGDQANLIERKTKGRQRLEKLFYKQTVSSLAFDGILVLIVPDYTLDKEFEVLLTRHFSDLSIYRAIDPTYKQVIVFGKRKRTTEASTSKNWLPEDLSAIPPIPQLSTAKYALPHCEITPSIVYTKMDSYQLEEELFKAGQNYGMWTDFDAIFKSGGIKNRQPLMDLSNWHLALALAAGQVTGLVSSNDDTRHLLIKGGTHKEKEVDVKVNETGDGDITEIRTHIDKFVSEIKAIDTTKGPNYGNIVTIR